MTNKMNTYIGKRGYTVYKSSLTKEQCTQLENELTLKPIQMGGPKFIKQKKYPIYLQTPDKYFVPIFYGIDTFGKTDDIRLSKGDDINVTYNGALRDYQVPVIEKYLNAVADQEVGGGILQLHTAWGKTKGALYVVAKVGKKTIIGCHTEFLMNQWIERIQDTLPDARVGIIQGNTFDIEDKDIVLFMIQTVCTRDYDLEAFSSFGLLIVDEAHHISSESFSKILTKIVTPYRLGLSARIERKDGTDTAIEWFMGPIIETVVRKVNSDVIIHKILYESNDPEFNEVILDYNGSPQMSSMITKVCNHSPRSDFICQVMTQSVLNHPHTFKEYTRHLASIKQNQPKCMRCNTPQFVLQNTCCNSRTHCLNCSEHISSEHYDKETIAIHKEKANGKKKARQPVKCPVCKKKWKYEQSFIGSDEYIMPMSDRHVIILSHNLSLLHYIYKKMVHENYASVAYYVGGMKQEQLKRSESSQFLLATYSMAAEALDIPSLNTEFIITSKVDVMQSVGRILRAQHPIYKPTVYDITDTHDLFKRQYRKRRQYFKSQGYTIHETTSRHYLEDHIGCWNQKKETIQNPITEYCSLFKNDSDDSDNDELEESVDVDDIPDEQWSDSISFSKSKPAFKILSKQNQNQNKKSAPKKKQQESLGCLIDISQLVDSDL